MCELYSRNNPDKDDRDSSDIFKKLYIDKAVFLKCTKNRDLILGTSAKLPDTSTYEIGFIGSGLPIGEYISILTVRLDTFPDDRKFLPLGH
ncbi:MAG: hypothetical protein ACFFDT_31575 [Candidatus Hodarchaeota archaeon]